MLVRVAIDKCVGKRAKLTERQGREKEVDVGGLCEFCSLFDRRQALRGLALAMIHVATESSRLPHQDHPTTKLRSRFFAPSLVI
jgi:hypothetical protein